MHRLALTHFSAPVSVATHIGMIVWTQNSFHVLHKVAIWISRGVRINAPLADQSVLGFDGIRAKQHALHAPSSCRESGVLKQCGLAQISSWTITMHAADILITACLSQSHMRTQAQLLSSSPTHRQQPALPMRRHLPHPQTLLCPHLLQQAKAAP